MESTVESTVAIVTFRDIFQDEAGKKSKFADEFRTLAAQVLLDKQDMAKLGLKDGQKVMVKNDVGSVVVAARASGDDPHPGLVWMTASPWSNQLLAEDYCAGEKPWAGITATLSPTEESVTQISEILQRMRA